MDNKNIDLHKNIKDKLAFFIKYNKIPHILFHGPSGSGKRTLVLGFRKNKDIYTNTNGKDIGCPEVDHIVEDQIVGHATANAIAPTQSYVPFIGSIKDALNLESLENYNVTDKKINISKGSIIKNYLRDNMNRGYPLRSLIKPETYFGQNMELIFQAMNEAFPLVANEIANGRRSDGHISGGNTFQQISEELVKTFSEMDLDLDSGRKLRTRKK